MRHLVSTSIFSDICYL